MSNTGQPLMTYQSSVVNDLKDCLAVFSDLIFSLDCLRSLIEGNDQLDSIQKKSLLHSALLAYFKAYQHGDKFGFNRGFIATLPGEPVNLHERLKDLRDKWVAHKSGMFEDHHVGVFVNGDQVVGHGSFSVQFQGWGLEDLKMTYDFVVTMKDQVKASLSKCEAAFVAEVNGLDLTQVRLKDAKFTVK